jgi:hypothetical protein
MRKFLAAALLIAAAAAAGCTPTTTPSTSSSTSTTNVSTSGLREAYLPAVDAMPGQVIGTQPSSFVPDLSIDSANYPTATALSARVVVSGKNLGLAPGSPYGVCVSVEIRTTGVPVGNETCVSAFVATNPANTSQTLLWPTPVASLSDSTGIPRITVTGMLQPGENRYGVRIRPADGFTCTNFCSLSVGTVSLRASW